MDDLRSSLDRKAGRLRPDPDAYGRVLERAGRRQTGRRVAALAVGVAIFVGGALLAWTGLRPDPVARPGGGPVSPEPTAASVEATPTSEPSATPPTRGADNDWLTEQDRIAWQERHGDGLWVAAYFLPEDAADTDPGEIDLELRWKRIGEEAEDLTPDAFLAEAFGELADAAPAGLINALAGIDLEVRSGLDEGDTVTLEMGPGILDTNRLGSTGGGLASVQLRATVVHYYPQASTLCLLLDGEAAQPVFHDTIGCPMDLSA